MNASAVQSDWVEEPHVKTRLIAGRSASNGDLAFGLEISLDKGWKTYWRIPGDGGIAPKLDWSESSNIKYSTLYYPTPKRFVTKVDETESIETFGYADHVVLPVTVMLKDNNKPVTIKLKGQIGACDEICIFHQFEHELTFKFDYDDYNDAITNALRAATKNIFDDSPDIITYEIKDKFIELTATRDYVFNDPDLIIWAGPDFRFTKPSYILSDDKKTATFKAPYEILLEGKDLSAQELDITIINGNRSINVKKK